MLRPLNPTARISTPIRVPSDVKLTFAQGGRPEKHRGESVEEIAVGRRERSAAEERGQQHACQSRAETRGREGEHLRPIDANS